jgi:hypothetical protein
LKLRLKQIKLGIADVEKIRFSNVSKQYQQNLNISNPLQKLKCYVYDILGKLILSKTALGSNTNYSFSTSI